MKTLDQIEFDTEIDFDTFMARRRETTRERVLERCVDYQARAARSHAAATIATEAAKYAADHGLRQADRWAGQARNAQKIAAYRAGEARYRLLVLIHNTEWDTYER